MDATELTKRLVACASVTPDQAGCHDLLSDLFLQNGWMVRNYDHHGVSNLVASIGDGAPVTLFAGHCDVVPPGDLASWDSPPFEPAVRDGFLFGRGAADMKSGLAAMATAMIEHSKTDFSGRMLFLSTSDEEGLGIHGTAHALDQLIAEGEKIDFAVVGEPTSEEQFGDMIKVGRRGSLNVRIVAQGTQGHVAYPHLAQNPVHSSLDFLSALIDRIWDDGYPHTGEKVFGPTTLQISNINAGTGAKNVIPGSLTIDLNLRFNPNWTVEGLEDEIRQMLPEFADVEFQRSANPFHTSNPELVTTVSKAVSDIARTTPMVGTGGGTSDARLIAAREIAVVEFGPINKTIHSVNECVPLTQIEECKQVFKRCLEHLNAV